MAIRKNLKQTQKTREKIQTSQLINRLQNHALSDEINELKPSQLKAIEILLKKSLPDLQSTEITGDNEAPVALKVITGIPHKSDD
jgi:5-methylcytosine-specific restriction endonuclease McrBC GTP-binding regulatory subunit McrB